MKNKHNLLLMTSHDLQLTGCALICIEFCTISTHNILYCIKSYVLEIQSVDKVPNKKLDGSL